MSHLFIKKNNMNKEVFQLFILIQINEKIS